MPNNKILHWIPDLSFFLGLSVGVVFALPLATDWLGNVIPDSAGNFWGAACGAGIAVVGALYVENRRRQDVQKQVAAWVFHFSNDVIYCLHSLNEIHGPVPKGVSADELDNRPLTPTEWSSVQRAAIAFTEARDRFNKNAERLTPVLLSLEISGMRAFYGLEYMLDKAGAVVHQISQQASKGGARSIRLRQELSIWCRNTEGCDNTLKRLGGELVPD